MYRFGITFFSVLLSAVSPLSAVSIKEGYPRHMETGDFVRLSEYFTGKEASGNRTIRRSQPDHREGEYFVLELDQATGQLPAGTQAVLEVIPSNSKESRSYSYTIDPNEASGSILYLGITGTDWESPEIQPVAWKAELISNGTTLASWKSFLWEMP